MRRPKPELGRRLWPLLLALPMLVALLDVGRCDAGRDASRRPANGPELTLAPLEPPRTEPRRRAPPRSPAPARAAPGLEPAPAPQITPSAPPGEQLSAACLSAGAYGRCDGNVASACVGGRVITHDCASEKQRCVMTREGASCLPSRGPLDCSEADAPVCTGNNSVRHCVDGSFEEIDCSLRLARCELRDGFAQCVSSSAAALELPLPEICNGKDDDHDAQVDEGAVCEAVTLIPFVAKGAVLHDLPARMQRELEIANRIYHPIAFAWGEAVEVPAEWRHLSPVRLGEAAERFSRTEATAVAEVQLAAQRPEASTNSAFFIPVLFVETIKGMPPKVGISTLPNARCGGVRISDNPAPPEGVVVVAGERRAETLAHEIGHYLGLCHTHMDLTVYAATAEPAAECEWSGDGICDTAFDPGPEQCAELESCAVQCASPGTSPDAFNVMSYYMGCRRALSAEQLAEAQRNLGLRRAWFRCLSPGDCPCTPGEPHACPEEMSCQPGDGGLTGHCLIDGPALPGAECAFANACSQGAVCIGGNSGPARCVRACSAAGDACTCTAVGLPFRVCSEDLQATR